MKYENVRVADYRNILGVVYDISADNAYSVAMEKGVADLDLDEFLDEYASDCVDEFKAKREAGATLNTARGAIHGHFVGSVEYAVAGDPYNGYETDYDMAFVTDNGQIFMAYKKNDGPWRLFNVKDLDGVIHWDVYPEDWDATLTRPESIKKPATKKKERLSDFIDNSRRKDCGDFLYVVKYDTGRNAYIGHNRKNAAKYMKTLRRNNTGCRVKVYPVHRQDECDRLSF